MSKAYKRCPICDASNPHKASFCNNCGAALADVDVEVEGTLNAYGRGTSYDFRYGETDLAEEGLRGKARAYLAGLLLTLFGAAAIFGIFVIYPAVRPVPPPTKTPNAAQILQATEQEITSRPTIHLATVTRGSPTHTHTPTLTLTPTPTETFTPAPCIQQVQPNDGMIAIIARCGHASLDVIPLVVTLNSLNNENDIRPGQNIIVPYPTQPAPPTEAADTETGSSADGVMVASAGGLSDEDVRATQAIDPFFRPTSTNPPGVQNYVVQPNDTIISVIAMFDTNINAMDMLNPDLTFSQCEMGTVFGGNTCSVPLSVGQMLRVPAPTPTPTLSPTPSGSETPTPTPTATYNAPSALSPTNRAYFRRDSIVTLRWAATAMLAADEIYLVTLQDLTRNQVFTGETGDLFFIVPLAWQGEANRHYEYAWTISIAKAGRPDSAAYSTAPLIFTWEGRGENQ